MNHVLNLSQFTARKTMRIVDFKEMVSIVWYRRKRTLLHLYDTEGFDMETVQTGQCGLCTHFGEHNKTAVLVSIVSSHRADLKVLDECGHPKHADLHLKVTPISGCDGFSAAA